MHGGPGECVSGTPWGQEDVLWLDHDIGQGFAPGIDILAYALRKEVASSIQVPLFQVDRFGV
jgi:hypothetical protein